MKRESRLRQKPASRPSQSGFGAQFMPISNAEKFKLGHYREPPEVDRNRFLAQSVCGVLMPLAPSPMKKGLFIIFAVVLAPVLLVGLVALAAGDWRQIGATPSGDQVLVSSVTLQKMACAPPGSGSNIKSPRNCR